tara:strand:- start:43 stop:615 length:573 start_codon:yes stop_codon:yes gene_type:complete
MRPLSLIILLLLAVTTYGQVTITVVESGSDLIMTATGSLDTTGLTAAGNTTYSPYLYPQNGAVITGANNAAATYYSGATAFGGSFGTAGFTAADAGGSGDLVYVSAFYLGLPQSYIDGTSLTSTNTFTDKSFSSLGLIEGTYVWSWPSDSITLVIGGSAVPEPASWAALCGAMGLIATGFRRRPRQSIPT